TADDQQHDVHRVGQLTTRDHPDARRRLGRQLVGPVLGQQPGGLPGAEAVIRVDAQPLRGIAGRERVPGGLPGGRLGGGHPVAPRYATTFVPASPATIAARSSTEPMAARWPVFPAKRAAALTFGPMDPAANCWPASSPTVTRSSRRAWGVPQST